MNNSCLIDTHVHSDNSPDGNHSCTFLCEQAVEKGLRAIAITDHCETDTYLKDHYDRSTMQSYLEILKAKVSFTGELIVLRGIELGQAVYDIPLAEKILAKQEYDIVIGSIHNLRGREDFYFMKQFTEEEAYAQTEEYLQELLLLTQWGKFDVLAHLTYPLRYFYARSGIQIDMTRFQKQTDELLALLAEKERALEINTAGLRQPVSVRRPADHCPLELRRAAVRRSSAGSRSLPGVLSRAADHCPAGRCERSYSFSNKSSEMTSRYFPKRMNTVRKKAALSSPGR